MSPAAISMPWEIAVIVIPLTGALLCLALPRIAGAVVALAAPGTLAAVAALGARTITLGPQRYAVGGWDAPLGIDLYSDGLTLLMLATTALVGAAVCLYAGGYFDARRARIFWPLWMLLWCALNALFLSADVFNLYVTLELMSLCAVTLIAIAGTREAIAAALQYLLVSLLGSLSYLLGVTLLYHAVGSLDIEMLGAGATPGAAVATAGGLMIAGLLLKTALFPLHFWLPAAHSNAPAPVSALLSALVVKASFYIFLRLSPGVISLSAEAMAELLGLLGACAVLWGGIQAVQQQRLKMMIAYSTVSQLGYLFLGFALGGSVALEGVLLLVLAHALAKAAMFMSAGNILHYAGHDSITRLDRVAQQLPLTLTAFALAGISIMGLPPSGGFSAKWLLLQAALDSGRWWWAAVLIVGGLLSAGYVLRVVGHAFRQDAVDEGRKAVPAVMQWTALITALGAIVLGFVTPLLLPWLGIGNPFGTASW